MWWCRFLVVLIALPVLAGCGFRPLYGSAAADGTHTVHELALIDVPPIRDRVGQEVRNYLVTLLSPEGTSSEHRYTLRVELNERISELAVERTGLATRANLRLNAKFNLIENASGKPLVSGSALAVTSYDIQTAEFALSTVTSQNDARSRAAQQIAEDIRGRLGLYFANRKTPPLEPGGST
jgi:LPS-assembly lipoprotein